MRWIGAALAVLLFSGSTPDSISIVYELDDEPLFTMAHPPGWSIVANAGMEPPAGHEPMPLLVRASPSVGKLWYGTWVCDKVDDFEEAEHYLGSLTEHLFDNVETTRLEEGTHNGMNFRYYEGTAVHLDRQQTDVVRENVDFFVAFFEPGDEGVGIALYVGLPSVTEEYEDVLRESLRSIRPFASTARLEE